MRATQKLQNLIPNKEVTFPITKLYYASYYFDLTDDSFVELYTAVPQVRATIGEQGALRAAIALMSERLVLPDYKAMIAEFTDIDTLSDRMKGKDYISCEYEGIVSGWSEAIFVVVDRLDDGTLQHVLLLIRTISNQKRIELENIQKLKDDLEFERLAMLSVQESLGSSCWNVRLDDDGKIISSHWNGTFRDALGYEYTDSINPKLMMELVHEDDLEEVKSRFGAVIKDPTMQSFFDMEFRVLTNDKGYKWFRAAGRVCKHDNMEGRVFFGVLVDVDEKIHAQQSFAIEKQAREKQLSILTSVADIYLTMHYIDLEMNTAEEIASVANITNLMHMKEHASQQMRHVIKNVVDEKHLQRAYEFFDLSTVAQRLQNKQIISEEFLGVNVGWFRASFIVVHRGDDGVAKQVLFTTLVIEEEKRREEELLLKSNTDKLTRFLNRTAYEEDMSAYTFTPPAEDFVFVSLDLNGLKDVNDTYGHNVGDELIKGAASCMQSAFGDYGKLYRIGGDEFVAMLHASDELVDRIVDDFKNAYRTWKGRYVDGMAISCGVAQKSKLPGASVEDLAEIADKHMYEEKAQYYKEKGVDRRGQLDAFNAICNSYTRIAKVNLTKDNYQEIQLADSEKQIFSMFSESVADVVRRGCIAEEDVEYFVKCTNIKGLQQYFKRGNKSFSMRYRRKIGDEFRLVMMEIIRTPDYTDENQHVFVYVKDIDFM